MLQAHEQIDEQSKKDNNVSQTLNIIKEKVLQNISK